MFLPSILSFAALASARAFSPKSAVAKRQDSAVATPATLQVQDMSDVFIVFLHLKPEAIAIFCKELNKGYYQDPDKQWDFSAFNDRVSKRAEFLLPFIEGAKKVHIKEEDWENIDVKVVSSKGNNSKKARKVKKGKNVKRGVQVRDAGDGDDSQDNAQGINQASSQNSTEVNTQGGNQNNTEASTQGNSQNATEVNNQYNSQDNIQDDDQGDDQDDDQDNDQDDSQDDDQDDDDVEDEEYVELLYELCDDY